jgi:hypothetical protein
MSEPFVRPWRGSSPQLPPWYWTCAHYPSALMARRAWERVERKTKRGGELGLYRHGSPDDPGSCVTALGLDRGAVERAAKLLSDGTDERLPPDLVEAMVVRRARVVVVAAPPDREAGRILIRRPESGAVLDERGRMHERGGQG